MAADRVKPDHAAQVQDCLATVMDPELDESVTELGFITDVTLGDDGVVQVGFRLPTYWCAANFAFLMADDMRRAVQALPWVSKVQVQLHEHMYAEAINAGVDSAAGFQAAFGEAAEGGLDGLRRTFELKAFQRRQEALLQHLLDAGFKPDQLAGLTVGDLPHLSLDDVGWRLLARYLARRAVAGPAAADAAAIVDTDGRPVDAAMLPAYLRSLRPVGINAEFNGALCRGLLAVRDRPVDVQPVHIVRRVQAAPAA